MSSNDNEPHWARVLHTLYETEQYHIQRDEYSQYNIPDDAEIIEHTGLSAEELREAVRFLIQAGLLEVSEYGNFYNITEEGFGVVHDRVKINEQISRESKRSQTRNRINLMIATLTFGLMFVTVTDPAVGLLVEYDMFAVAVGFVVFGYGLSIGIFANFLFSDSF